MEPVEGVFPSTTWEYRRTKIRRPPDGQQDSRPKAAQWHGLPPREIKGVLHITVTWRGGGECWYEIHARGRTGRVPGYLAIHDIMRMINGDSSYGPRSG